MEDISRIGDFLVLNLFKCGDEFFIRSVYRVIILVYNLFGYYFIFVWFCELFFLFIYL